MPLKIYLFLYLVHKSKPLSIFIIIQNHSVMVTVMQGNIQKGNREREKVLTKYPIQSLCNSAK